MARASPELWSDVYGWSDILAVAAYQKAHEVAKYCLAQGTTVDCHALRSIIHSRRSESIYRFFAEARHVDINYSIE
jgi:hypothetical protein